MDSPRQSLDFTAMVILLVLCASWGLNQVSIKVVNQGVSPLMQCGIRSIGATILLLIWMVIRRDIILEKDGT